MTVALKNAKTILIADGQPTDLQLFSQVLSERYTVHTAHDGATALAMSLALVPNLILLDIKLPGMDGFEFCRRLRQHPLTRDVQVVLFYAMDESDHALHDFEPGLNFIRKPIGASQLKARVASQLALADAMGELRRERNLSLSIMDSMQTSIVLLSEDGEILRVNRVWTEFAQENAAKQDVCIGVGLNYFETCRRSAARGEVGAGLALAGMQDVLSGVKSLFLMEYPCDAPGEKRWFLMRVVPLVGSSARASKGLVVSHTLITDRKLSEQSQVEREEFVNNIIDTAPNGILIAQASGTIVRANRHAHEIFCYGPDELVGQSIESLLPDRFRAQHLLNQARFMAKPSVRKMGGSIAGAVMGLRKKGDEFSLEAGLSHVNLRGETHVVVTLTDTSERERDLLALRASEERNRQLFESSRDALMTMAPPSWQFTAANQATLTMFGASGAAEFTALGLWDVSPQKQPDGSLSADKAKEMIEVALRDGDCFYEWQHQCLDGHPFAADVLLTRMEVGSEVFLQATVRDITERKQIEARLAAEKAGQVFEALFNASSTPHVVLNSQEQIASCNPAFLKLLDYPSVADIVGKHPTELAPVCQPDGRNSVESGNDKAGLAIERGCLTFEWWCQDRHGTSIPVEVTIVPLMLDGQRRLLSMWHDLRSRRETERQLRAARDTAEAANIAKSEFLANMSHELRTPLNACLGLAQIGLREGRDARSHQLFGQMLDSGKMLLGIVNDILDFSKIDAGELCVDKTPIDLTCLIGHLRVLSEGYAAGKDITLSVEQAHDMPTWIVGDSLRLTQVLGNLLSNAFKFTERGRVALAVGRQDERLVFRVSDTGIGITTEQLGRIFRAFEQADSSSTRRFGGAGLGLAISKRLVELMDGTITVTSTTHIGSTFEVSVPLETVDPPPDIEARREGDADVHRAPGEGRLANYRILAAEDNPVNQMVLEDMLTMEGATLVCADDGVQVLDVLQREGEAGFDLVLTDIQMPNMDGHQLASLLRQRYPTLPVIGLTAHAYAQERQRCLDHGMVAHLTKPVEIDELVAAVREHARR